MDSTIILFWIWSLFRLAYFLNKSFSFSEVEICLDEVWSFLASCFSETGKFPSCLWMWVWGWIWMLIVVSAFVFISAVAISSIFSFNILPFLLIDSSIFYCMASYFACISFILFSITVYVTLLLSPLAFNWCYLFLNLFEMVGSGLSIFGSIGLCFFFDDYLGFASFDFEGYFLL